MENKIIVKGARENNLKNVNIELPKNKLIVMTGLYSVNLRIMGKSNIPLFSTLNIFHGNIQPIAVAAIFLIVVKVSVDFLLKTKFGFALRATGNYLVAAIVFGIFVAIFFAVTNKLDAFASRFGNVGTAVLEILFMVLLTYPVIKDFKKAKLYFTHTV